MKYYFDTFSTPMGEFSVVLDDTGAVVATTFGGEAELREYFHQGDLVRDPQLAVEARRQVTEFFAKQRRRFTLKLAPHGTAFQKRVWSALEQIPFGETRSHGQIAAAVGSPGAARAVALSIDTRRLACRPRGPCTTSQTSLAPSLTVLTPDCRTQAWCKRISGLPSNGAMKP